MRKRMACYGYVTHNEPSFEAPDLIVCVGYGYYDRLGRAAETHQLLAVSRPWTSELCDVPPLTLKCPAFQLIISHELQRAVADAEYCTAREGSTGRGPACLHRRISCEIRPRYSLNDETEKRATLTPEYALSWREWETQ